MAAPVVVAAAEAAVVRSSGPALCPSFAEVCSFMERYGAALDLPDMTFPQMERYLRDTTAVPKPLVELHVKLLRKLGKSVTTDRWEKYLVKVCQDLNNTWAWELEQKGYQEMSMECKSSILKHLCECQFDDNLKFKSAINEEDPEKMRLQPVGKDRHGLMYWLQLDQEKNIRLYTEEQDDQDGSTWKCIVRNRNDLAEALDLLKSQLDPSQIKDQNPDQTGPGDTSPTQKDTGEDAIEGTKSEPSRTSEEHADSKETEPANEEKPLIQVVKQEATDVEMKEEEEAEEKSDLKPPAFDNRVSTITTVIKSECRDSGDAPKKNAVSVVMAPVTKQEVNKEDDHAVRSSQQAKIPLKKRELKLAESYQSMNNLNHSSSTSNSSIIVCNPSVIQNKDSHNAREGKLSNSTAPPSETQTSQQQQLVVTASRQELTNGKGLQKQAQNGVIGVIGQVGVIGHVGVIRRATEQAELNGPNSDPEKDVSRQSVLVRKGPVVEMETVVASATTTTPKSALQSNAAKETETARKPTLISFKSGPKIPENTEGKVDCVTVSALAQSKTQEPKTKMAEDQENKGKIADHQEKDINTEERTSSEACLEKSKDDNEKKPKCTLEKSEVEPESTVPPVDCNQDQKDQQKQTEGVNGGLAAPSTVKETGVGLEGKQGPLEEASSELQKEGIRLKIKIPPHRRRSKQRGKGKEEEREMEGEGDEDGRMLRRSSRICRSSALPNCRPSSKAADSPKKKTQKKQNDSTGTRGGEEEEEEEEDDEQGLTAKKDRKTQPVGLIRKQRGKRRHRRPKWTNSKRRKLTEGGEGEGEEVGGKGGEEGSDGGSESEEESCKSEELPMEDACSHCGLPNHPELILLCDSCDNGYHTACLRPPLMLIPDGQWFCPPCQHKLLCEKLEEQLLNLDSDLKKKERAERRRERLVYVGISVENIIPEGDEEEEEEQKSAKKKDSKKSKNLGRRSTRTRKNISYRFDDFDDAIDEAIEEDVGDIGGGADRGKGIGADLSEEGRESRGPIRSQQLLSARRSRKRRRLNDLESDSTAAESEDEFMITNSSEEEEFAASGADEDDDDEDGGSEPGSLDRRGKASAKHKPGKTQRGKSKGGQSKRSKGQPGKTQRRGRKPLRRRRRRSSEEEEEDTEEDMNSDQISDMTDSEDEKKRRGLRRGQRQQVNYRETSVSSDNSRAEAKKVTPRPRGRPRKEHLSTDYSDASSRSSRDSEEEDEEGDQRRRDERRRRREEEKEGRHGHKRRRHDDRDDVTENDDDVTENDDDLRERGSSRKRSNNKDKTDKEEKRRRLKRTHRDREEEEKEDMEKMGRGKRREILSEQRRKRLALMLKKRRPSTDEDDDDDESKESTSEEESESTSEEDRPVRKRLNRIDSDEDEEMEEEEEEGRLKSKKSSAVESDSTPNKGRDSSTLSPSNEQRTATRPESPTPAANSPKDRAGGDRHNGPKHSGEEEEKEEEEDNEDEDEDTLNSVQNSPAS